MDSFADDLAALIRRLDQDLRDRHGRSEIHLLGHSFGGLVVLRFSLAYRDLPVLSTTLSAPFLGIRARVPAHKRVAASFLSHVWGSLQLSTELDPSKVSRDPAVVEAYKRDRLVHGKMTPQFFSQLLDAFRDTRRRGPEIQVPIQMLSPLDDQITDQNVAIEFYKTIGSPDKRLKTYPGFYHEPMNELGKEQVFEDIGSWILAHPRSG